MKYEKWSLGYWLLKQYIIFVDWFIHRKIIINGKGNIPLHKPLLFAPNHQNALSDPLAVLLHTRFQPVWLARADIFGRSKLIDTLLRFLKIMPVYRMQDGKENLVKNEKTFADSIKVLEHNFALALFPEAAHSRKRQMLVHKKAVPRIVYMAEEKTGFNLDIQIIPTGIYYNHYWKFDRSLIVNFGEPISVREYSEMYRENQNTAIIAIQKKIQNSLEPLVIEIKSKKHYNEFEKIRSVYGKHYLKKQQLPYSLFNLFTSDQKLVKKLDLLEATNPQKAAELSASVNEYFQNLEKLKIRDWLINKRENSGWKFILAKLILIAGLPVFIFGFIFNAIPFLVIDRFIRKKVKDWSFWSSFFLVAGIVVFPLVYLSEFLAVAWLIPGIWLKLLFLISLPFAGKLAFKWYILFRKIIGRLRMLRLKWMNENKYRMLLHEKKELIQELDLL